jgi:hypothetical protein
MEMFLFIMVIGLTILGALGYLEQLFGFKWSKKTLVLLLICYILLTVGQQLIQQYSEKAKDAEIKQLNKQTETLREFSDMAVVNPAGLPFIEGSGIKLDSPLSTALRDLYVINDKISFKLGRQFEDQYRKICVQFPRFPFAYFALASSLRHRGDPEWRIYAEQAVAIFKKTTIIAGHNPSHDEALHLLQEWLAKP